MGCKKSNTSNNRDYWNYLKVIQKITLYRESTKAKNCRIQPYWQWHAYFGKPKVKIRHFLYRP
jgi:hypothetical protein